DEVALPVTAASGLESRRGRRALPDPAGLDGELLAERTDVDELGALRRSEADGAFAHQQRPFADGARLRRSDLRDPHPDSSLARIAQTTPQSVMCLTCVFYM